MQVSFVIEFVEELINIIEPVTFSLLIKSDKQIALDLRKVELFQKALNFAEQSGLDLFFLAIDDGSCCF